MISDGYFPFSRELFARSKNIVWTRDPDKVAYPRELTPVLDRLGLGQGKMVANPDLAEEMDHNVLKLAYATLATYPVDLVLIFLDSADQLFHLNWHTHEPAPGEHPQADVVVDYVKRLDAMVGDLLARLDAGDHFVLLSDHGMERNPNPTGLTGEHLSAETAVGVIAVHGPRVRRGARLPPAALVDVLPTLLQLLRLPAAADMPGSVLGSMFNDGERVLPRRATYRTRP
jgi:hypothetical protein